jgi:curved DNA-binding protein CbpA
MSDHLNYYTILNVAPKATLLEIKQAYRRLVRQYHPDLNPDSPTAHHQFQVLSEAYQVLSDAQQRANYDQQYQRIFHSHYYTAPTAEDYYHQGMEKMAKRQYIEAIKNYHQALTLKPHFLEVYLKRCEAYFYLQIYPEVLEDCYQILKIDNQVWQAYYYQGRVRQKLGYSKAAIESYTRAIILHSQEATIYYYRGLAYQELGRRKFAYQDFNTAAKEYKKQNNSEGYRYALRQLKRSRSFGILLKIFDISEGIDLLKILSLSIFQVLLNPSGEMLPKFSQLNAYQKLSLGLFYGLIPEVFLYFLLPHYQFLGLIIWGCLMIWIMLINLQNYRKLNVLASLFVIGFFSLSLNLMVIIYSFLDNFSQGLWIGIIFLTLLGSSSFLTLYCGFTQILNFSEQKSTYLMSLTLLLIFGLFYLVNS